MLWIVACTTPEPESVLAYARDAGGGYSVGPRIVPELTDPFTMHGTLGDVGYGGTVSLVNGTWQGGRPITVAADVQDGVAIPPDEDGLLLYSFYAHLADGMAGAAAHGVETDALFPLDIAYNPAVSPLLELQPMDNAAYVTGSHFFVLLPDGYDRDVPMTANAGVVAHELGHAILHRWVAGGVWVDPPADTTTKRGQWLASIHEGFADLFAALLLDDPRFLDASVDMPARWMDAGATTDTVSLPTDTAALIYDPYPLGTVFASLAWDLRVADAPDTTLDAVLRATEAWAATGTLDGFAWVDAWGDEVDADTLCAAVAVRAPGHEAEAGCP